MKLPVADLVDGEVKVMCSFSYHEYALLIQTLVSSHPYMDFNEVNSETSSFVLLRHDVEFSMERAQQMAFLENMLGIRSSYFFQIRNEAYNLFSSRNISIVRTIQQLGHHIGLHVHLGMLDHINQLKDYIIQDVAIMGRMLHVPIDRFSYHRPTKDVLSLHLKIEGLINVYDDLYFEFTEGDFTNLKIKYLADSRHQWKYGYPNNEMLKKQSKIQLLIHPDEWTTTGYDVDTNFRILHNEKLKEFNHTVRTECDHYNQGIHLMGE